jgi:hypothetical protein
MLALLVLAAFEEQVEEFRVERCRMLAFCGYEDVGFLLD